MNSNYSSSLIGGGGNSLNIINIYSKNIFDKIIKSSDLNGTIVPYDVNVWKMPMSFILVQDNIRNTNFFYCHNNIFNDGYQDKSLLYSIDTSISIQIKYRE